MLLPLFAAGNAQHPLPPKYEYRAVWLTAIENLDWPKTPALTPLEVENQKHSLTAILDTLQAMNVNTVLL